MWGSVQTVRGCPKHCSFCSVWRTDGQKPRQRRRRRRRRRDRRAAPPGLPLHRARRRQLLSGDAGRSRAWPSVGTIKARLEQLQALRARALRADGRGWRSCRDDMVFFTQITMEAAEDPAFLDGHAAGPHPRRAGRRRGGHARRAEGRLQGLQRRRRGARRRDCRRSASTACTCSARSSSACRAIAPSTFAATADLAERAGVSFAQFVMLHAVSRHGRLRARGRRAWATTPRRSTASRSRATG